MWRYTNCTCIRERLRSNSLGRLLPWESVLVVGALLALLAPNSMVAICILFTAGVSLAHVLLFVWIGDPIHILPSTPAYESFIVAIGLGVVLVLWLVRRRQWRLTQRSTRTPTGEASPAPRSPITLLVRPRGGRPALLGA